jgi:ubiquitin-conjugating enzyme E2 A
LLRRAAASGLPGAAAGFPAEAAGSAAMSAEGAAGVPGAGASAASKQRLMTDLKEMHNEPPEGCSAAPANDSNLFVWNASIIGPDESAWEGGIYGLRLQFPEQYPSKPPKVRFTCEMFHPNVYADGTLCLDIIQDQWSPIYTTSTILTSIQSLLTDPNPNSPANPEAARLFRTDPKEYKKRVRRIASKSLEG